MKVGDKYRIRDIGGRDWRKLATELHLDPSATLARMEALAANAPAQLAELCARAAVEGLRNPLVQRLRAAVATRAQRCIASLKSAGG